jgi:hypothetical protein
MRPPTTPTNKCFSERAKWFRNLAGTEAFGRFEPKPSGCETALTGVTLTAADYSLQLSETVTRSVAGDPSFNPCTWDDTAIPTPGPPAPPARIGKSQAPPRVFPVTR